MFQRPSLSYSPYGQLLCKVPPSPQRRVFQLPLISYFPFGPHLLEAPSPGRGSPVSYFHKSGQWVIVGDGVWIDDLYPPLQPIIF